MRDFIEDGFVWVWKRNADDYVLAKDNTGLSAYDVPRDWKDCSYDFDKVEYYYITNPDKHFEIVEPDPTEEETLKQELSLLLEWFETYDEKVMHYQRDIRAGRTSEIDIVTLDAQADIKAERIKEIREILGQV